LPRKTLGLLLYPWDFQWLVMRPFVQRDPGAQLDLSAFAASTRQTWATKSHPLSEPQFASCDHTVYDAKLD
jgi:hypothetical protein